MAVKTERDIYDKINTNIGHNVSRIYQSLKSQYNEMPSIVV